MSGNVMIATDDANVSIRRGARLVRTRLRITELPVPADPVRHVAIAYLDDDQRCQLIAALSDPAPSPAGEVAAVAADGLAEAARNVATQATRRASDNYAAIHHRTLAELQSALDTYDAARQRRAAGERTGE